MNPLAPATALRAPRMILIDVDGTMVDSVPDLAYCVDELMKALDRPAHGEARVRNWVGNGVERLVRRALVGQLDGEPPEEEFARAFPIFVELYAVNTSRRSRLYPGVREGIDWLKSQGYRLGCVTNKAARFTLPLLTDLGIRDDFELVVSGDTLPVKKPDPAPLLHAARRRAVDLAQPKLRHVPAFITFVKPFALSLRAAKALRVPDAQATTTHREGSSSVARVEFLQRDVQRAGHMAAGILTHAAHVHELRARALQLREPAPHADRAEDASGEIGHDEADQQIVDVHEHSMLPGPREG